MMYEMPVKCLNEKCVNCPELEIEVTHIYMKGENQDLDENHLYCVHWRRCAMIEDQVKKQMNKKDALQVKIYQHSLYLHGEKVRDITEDEIKNGCIWVKDDTGHDVMVDIRDCFA